MVMMVFVGLYDAVTQRGMLLASVEAQITLVPSSVCITRRDNSSSHVCFEAWTNLCDEASMTDQTLSFVLQLSKSPSTIRTLML